MRVLNLGSINIDYVYDVPHFVRAGETLSSVSRQIFSGGKGLNQSIALARAGADVVHAGMVGADGGGLIETLNEANVDVTLIDRCGVATGHTIIQVIPEGDNCILLYPGANRELDKIYIDKALSSFSEEDILLLQNEVNCVSYAIQTAKNMGMAIAFNPSPFEPNITSYPLDLVDWWLLNEVEGRALTGKENPIEILSSMGSLYPKAVVVLTLGKDGVLCQAGNNTFTHNSFVTNVVDTTAAGDTFTGYFIASYAKNKNIMQALNLASKAAAITVSRRGAATSIPLLGEVLSANFADASF